MFSADQRLGLHCVSHWNRQSLLTWKTHAEVNRGIAIKHFFYFIKHWFSPLLQTQKKQFVYVGCLFFLRLIRPPEQKDISKQRIGTHAHQGGCTNPSVPSPPPIFALRPATLLIMSPEGCLSRITKFFFSPARVKTWLNQNWIKLFLSHFGSCQKS